MSDPTIASLWEVGALAQVKVFPRITQADLIQYAMASGDDNSIHLSEEAARRMGLPGIIAHGMLIASYLAEAARDFFNERTQGQYRLLKTSTRFRNMTLLGEILTARGVVKTVEADQVSFEFEARNEKQELKATSRFTLKLAP